MITQDTVLVQLIRLIERIPSPQPPPRRRGRPIVYSEKLFLKALMVMVVRRLHKVGELLAVLDEPTPEMRETLTFDRRVEFPNNDVLSISVSSRVVCRLPRLLSSVRRSRTRAKPSRRYDRRDVLDTAAGYRLVHKRTDAENATRERRDTGPTKPTYRRKENST